MSSISAAQASEIQDRNYRIVSEVNDIIRKLPLSAAEELLDYCRKFQAKY